MNWNNASQYLQVGANLGILGGLLLVSIQILDTNRIANAQFIADDLNAMKSSYELLIGEDLPQIWGKAALNSSELVVEELAVIDAFLKRQWFQSLGDQLISETGIKEYSLEDDVDEWVFSFLGNKTAITWWTDSQYGVLEEYTELRDAINNRLSVLGENHNQLHEDRLNNWFNGRDSQENINGF